MSLPSASPIRIVYSIAFSFGTGSDPGSARQTGQVFVFGGDPNSLRHPQNIFVALASSTWHSNPITVSNASGIVRNDTGLTKTFARSFVSLGDAADRQAIEHARNRPKGLAGHGVVRALGGLHRLGLDLPGHSGRR